MTSATQDEKRKRAASFPAEGGLAAGSTAVPGPLAVQWDSVFDRMCYMVTSADLAVRNARRYRKLMDEIVAATGCSEDEILAHGNKVRAVLYFAQDRLTKQGALNHLVGKEKFEFRLPPVSPIF
jgi:hypothetical protein